MAIQNSNNLFLRLQIHKDSVTFLMNQMVKVNILSGFYLPVLEALQPFCHLFARKSFLLSGIYFSSEELPHVALCVGILDDA